MTDEIPPYSIPSIAELLAVPENGLTVLSTFSGTGGSCLGFRWAGFRTVAAVEFVEAARESYAANFPGVPIYGDDIRGLSGSELLALAGVDSVDVLEGSPPCSSFSTAGRRQQGWGESHAYSDTNQRVDDLFYEFVRLVDEIRPRAFVAENVSGLVKGTAKGYFREIIAGMRDLGYRVAARVLDAQWLGVPQRRQRVIFVGLRDDVPGDPPFPSPLPYRYSITDALPWLGAGAIRDGMGSHYTDRDLPVDAPAPTIPAQLQGRTGIRVESDGPPPRVVGGPGSPFGNKGRAFDLDAPLVGINTPSHHFYVEGDGPSLAGYAVGREYDRLAPGASSDKYLNLVRPDVDEPCPTVTQLGGSNPGVASVVHPTERRKFTIAELRRLCGFPDDFVLTGTYAQQWERCGRAVPPPMMRAVAAEVAAVLLDQPRPSTTASRPVEIDETARAWREALLATIGDDAGAPLLLSGGMDSTTLLAACAALGRIPPCYTVRLEGERPADLVAAENAARLVDAPLTVVTIPRDLDRLVDDVRDVIRLIGRSGKAAIQCAHPILYLARAVAADGHDSVMVGTGGICEDNRTCTIAAREARWDDVDAIRRKNIDGSSDSTTATAAMHAAALDAGLRVVEPYATEPLRTVALDLSWDDLNQPRQKGIALRAFPEFYGRLGWRRNSSLQIGSGIRAFHDELLGSPANRRDSKAVIAIYNDLAAEVLA